MDSRFRGNDKREQVFILRLRQYPKNLVSFDCDESVSLVSSPLEGED